jgi:flagellar assembly protein FliH
MPQDPSTAQTPRKFAFDTVFSDGGDIASQPAAYKRFYTGEEVERLVAQAAAEADTAAIGRIEGQTAIALEEISGMVRQAFAVLAAAAHEHRVGAAELALACGKVIAGEALERFPEAPAAAALEALAREVESSPKLTVRVAPALVERLQAALDATATAVGFAGQIRCAADPTLPSAAFAFDWGDGRAAYDPVAASARVAEALNAALASEGLHGEALPSVSA